MDKLDTVEYMTDRYLERYGRALIGIYYLPQMAQHNRFTVFMNSLLITLRRLDLIPAYTWFMDAYAGYYLILWLNGYFRNDLSGINPTINRLWQIHLALPLNVLDSFVIFSESSECGKDRLKQLLYSSGLNHLVTANRHQRTWGCSRLL